jgi:hypothetical protein
MRQLVPLLGNYDNVKTNPKPTASVGTGAEIGARTLKFGWGLALKTLWDNPGTDSKILQASRSIRQQPLAQPDTLHRVDDPVVGPYVLADLLIDRSPADDDRDISQFRN